MPLLVRAGKGYEHQEADFNLAGAKLSKANERGKGAHIQDLQLAEKRWRPATPNASER